MCTVPVTVAWDTIADFIKASSLTYEFQWDRINVFLPKLNFNKTNFDQELFPVAKFHPPLEAYPLLAVLILVLLVFFLSYRIEPFEPVHNNLSIIKSNIGFMHRRAPSPLHIGYSSQWFSVHYFQAIRPHETSIVFHHSQGCWCK